MLSVVLNHHITGPGKVLLSNEVRGGRIRRKEEVHGGRKVRYV